MKIVILTEIEIHINFNEEEFEFEQFIDNRECEKSLLNDIFVVTVGYLI
jgi:hypothetical protein